MRKYSALFAMIITLWGAFAPIGFSVLQVGEQNQEVGRNIISLKMGINKAYAVTPNQDGSCNSGYKINAAGTDCVKNINNDGNANGLDCSIWEGDLFCYLVKFTVYLVSFVPNLIASVSGLLSDFFLKLAIDPSMYGSNYESGIGSMIHTAWKIIRDFANIGFIFALFISAFMMILNKTSVGGTQFDPKRTVVRVIIMALLVNFSLLFCRLIIQTADVFSNVLYSKITTDTEGTGSIETFLKNNNIKSVSFGLINNSNPQKLFTSSQLSKEDPGSYTAYLAIGFITFFIYLIYIYIFTSMMFIWLGRIIGAWIAMILSPLAFVSFAIPFIENDKNIGFENWIKNYVKLAFLVPLYLFFVYIAVTVLKLENLGNLIISENTNWITIVIGTIISVMLPVLASTFILMQGKKIATDMSGVIGEIAGKMSGAVTGLALGAATGGTALLARQSVGRLGSMAANATEGKTGILGGINKLGKSAGAATFDVRNNKFAMDKFGSLTGAAGEKIDLGTKGLQKEGGYIESGGFTQMYQDRKDAAEDKAATAAEEKARAQKLNPQSRENIAARKAARALAKAQKEKEAEEARIAAEAGEQIVNTDSDINTTNTEIAGNEARMTAIDTELAGKKEMTEKELADNKSQKEKAEADMAAANTKSADIDAKLAANTKKVGTTAKQSQDIIDEKAALEKEKADNEKQKAIIQTDLASTTAKEKEHNDVAALKKEKVELDEKNKGLKTKLVSLQNVNGKTVNQLRDEAEKDKVVAMVSKEKMDADKAEKEANEQAVKLAELKGKQAKARKEGDIQLFEQLKNDIDEEADKLVKLRTNEKKMKDEYKTKYGDNIKQMEKTAKDKEKEYKTNANQIARIDKMDTGIRETTKKLAEANLALKTKNKEILNNVLRDMEKTGTGLTQIPLVGRFISEGGSKQVANAIGVISGGRIWGGAVGNASQQAVTSVRNNSRTGK